ncbi:FG-GAP-like repeat-containing protein [Luteolibacter marinus]|uniref:FG-GAP-like repeat-containing protein n=1 Tax=Luteolibacter marinus TaxID=2776705 RepID=UPI0018661B83|nr:FG-GAP-like repeat-containing protein [Luteolibacter marinus]
MEVLPASPEAAPFWHFSPSGNQVGKSGLFLLETGNGSEIFATASVDDVNERENSFWHVSAHDPATNSYVQRHVQAPYFDETAGNGTRISGFFPVDRSARPRVVVVLSDGRVISYDATSRVESGRFEHGSPIQAGTAADLDGDGRDELLLQGDDGLSCCDLSGAVRWRLAAASGDAIACGQLDGDAALEVVTSSGHVIDGAKGKVQWKRSVEGGWRHVAVGDIDAYGGRLWIACDAAGAVHGMDVERKKTRWVIPSDGTVHWMSLEPLDGDAYPELVLVGNSATPRVFEIMGEFGPVSAWRETITGFGQFVVGDPDSDGELEVIGSNSSGLARRLRVASLMGMRTEWESSEAGGPFLSPVVGDMTGDGVPEIVTAAAGGLGIDSVGVVVFDGASLRPIASTSSIGSSSRPKDGFLLRLRDMNGDGRLDLLMPGTWDRRDGVEFRTLGDDGELELLGSVRVPSPYEAISAADVMDVDGDGDLELVAGSAMSSSFADGVYLRVFDLATGSLEWTSPRLSDVRSGVVSLELGDVDGDQRIEAVVAIAGTRIDVFDLGSGVHEAGLPGKFTSVAVPREGDGFAAGTSDGAVRWFVPGNGTYGEGETWTVSEESVKGLTPGEGRSMWVVAGRRVLLWRDGGGPVWAGEPSVAGEMAPQVGLLETADGLEMFTGFRFGIGASYVGGRADAGSLRLDAAGYAAEAREAEGVFTISRGGAVDGELAARLKIGGDAVWGEDFLLDGAEPLEDGTWVATIADGASSVQVRVRALEDDLEESTEQVSLSLVPAATYLCEPGGGAMVKVFDDQAVVALSGEVLEGAETAGPADGGALRFKFTRSGDLSRPLAVEIETGGTASAGRDYPKVGKVVAFRAGSDVAELIVQPIHDRMTEDRETLSIRLLESVGYGVVSDVPVTGTISDGEPTVRLKAAVPVPGGYRVILEKSGGVPGITKVKLRVATRASSRPKPNRTVNVSDGPDGGEFFIRSGPLERAVTIDLWPDRSYYLGKPSDFSITLPAKGR